MPTPPTFVTQDPAADIDEMVAYYESLTAANLHPAAVERLMLNCIAYRYSLLKAAIQDAAEQTLVDFARAPALDSLGIFYGVTRLAAAPATTQIQFTLVSGHGGVTIPGNTRVATVDGQVIFTTIEDVIVPALNTTATVMAEATTDGAAGNAYTTGNVTTILDPQPYLVSATNTTTTSGGADTEADEPLRARIKAAPAAFSVAGSRKAYRYHALSASALLSDVAVLAYSDDPVFPLGEVHIFPLMADGSVTPSGVLTAVEEACTAEEVRPLSDTVVVTAPTKVDYDITASITIFNSFDPTDTQAAIEDYITEWAEARRQTLGIDITDTQVITAISNAVPGAVYDLTLTGWTDVVIAATEYGNLDNLTITIAGTTAG